MDESVSDIENLTHPHKIVEILREHKYHYDDIISLITRLDWNSSSEIPASFVLIFPYIEIVSMPVLVRNMTSFMNLSTLKMLRVITIIYPGLDDDVPAIEPIVAWYLNKTNITGKSYRFINPSLDHYITIEDHSLLYDIPADKVASLGLLMDAIDSYEGLTTISQSDLSADMISTLGQRYKHLRYLIYKDVGNLADYLSLTNVDHVCTMYTDYYEILNIGNRILYVDSTISQKVTDELYPKSPSVELYMNDDNPDLEQIYTLLEGKHKIVIYSRNVDAISATLGFNPMISYVDIS